MDASPYTEKDVVSACIYGRVVGCQYVFLPSAAANTLATLSVLPAKTYSPDGLQARSYTCMEVHLIERNMISPHIMRRQQTVATYLKVVLGFQYSFSC